MDYALPLISVIMPAYNCSSFIAASIVSALNQTHSNIELIVIDDCSSDDSFLLAKEYERCDSRVKLYKNDQNIGVALTRNRAFALASGEFIALLDADDIWHTEKLEKQLAFMLDSHCDLCYTAYSFISETGASLGNPYFVPNKLNLKVLLRENVIGCSSVLMRASIVKSIPMRNEFAHEDYVFWLELMQQGVTACGLNEVLMDYRIVTGSRSANKWKSAMNRWRIYRTLLHLNVFEASRLFVSYAMRGLAKHIVHMVPIPVK